MLKPSAALFSICLMAAATPAGTAEDIGTTTCESRASVLDFLSSKYAEAPIAMGVAKNGSVVEVLTSGAGSTFTIIVTQPDGTTCMVAAGQGWETFSDLARKAPRI